VSTNLGEVYFALDRFNCIGVNPLQRINRKWAAFGKCCLSAADFFTRKTEGAMYLARPTSAHLGGVLLIHSWWGLNGFFRGLCDRFAAEGFVALAADLYAGRVAATAAEAKRLRAQVTASRREPAYKYLIRMIGELRKAAAKDEIAVVGFSMGGHWAYWLAQRPDLPIAATVTFYAARSGDYSKSHSSFLAHFAEKDEWVSAAGIKKLAQNLAKAGRSFEFHTYAGTDHWFFEDDRPDAFQPEGAALAWRRTKTFLKQRLG
jgi:carboxymethylenebutenolidase